MAIYISSLFIIRRKVMFPAAALFAWSGTAFLAIEFGYLTAIADIPVSVEFKIRAIVEALMVFALFVALYTFVELRKRMPIVGYVTLAAIALCAVLIGFAYQEPVKALDCRASRCFGQGWAVWWSWRSCRAEASSAPRSPCRPGC